MNRTFLWIVIAVVVIVGGLYLSGNLGGKNETPPTTENPTDSAALPNEELKPATGNIDDILAALMVEASADSEAPTDLDPSLIAPEDWSNLDQTLDTSNIE